jgi:hypothetical protein
MLNSKNGSREFSGAASGLYERIGALASVPRVGAEVGTSSRSRSLSGRLDAGVSEGVLDRLADGRLRLVEHYQWLTRPEHGTNTFEEIRSQTPQVG